MDERKQHGPDPRHASQLGPSAPSVTGGPAQVPVRRRDSSLPSDLRCRTTNGEDAARVDAGQISSPLRGLGTLPIPPRRRRRDWLSFASPSPRRFVSFPHFLLLPRRLSPAGVRL